MAASPVPAAAPEASPSPSSPLADDANAAAEPAAAALSGSAAASSGGCRHGDSVSGNGAFGGGNDVMAGVCVAGSNVEAGSDWEGEGGIDLDELD